MKKIRLLLPLLLLWSSASSYAARPFNIQHWQTSRGAEVVFYSTMEVPMLDIGVAFRAGSAYDGNRYGLSTLTMHLLDQGNRHQPASIIAEQLALSGAQYGVTNNQDMLVISLRSLTEATALKQAMKTLTLILTKPDFPLDAFERQKKLQLMSLMQDQESPNVISLNTFYQALYQQAPYAHPINGTTDTVQQITREHVLEFYQRYFNAHNATIVLVGAIDLPTAKQISEQLSSNLPKGQPAKVTPPTQPATEAMDVVVKFPSKQTVVRLGQSGPSHQDPDYFALQVGNYILGGNPMGSLLEQELREQRGLTYGVTSQILPMPGNGVLMLNFSTRNKEAKNAINLARSILTKFIEQGPDEQELMAAKNYLTGSFPLSLASNRNIVEILLKISFYHLPENFLDTYTARINAVSAADIKLAFQRHFNADKLVQVSVGKI